MLALGGEATASERGQEVYETKIEISDATPGAPMRLTYRIIATADDAQELERLESELPPGAGLNPKAFAARCVLEGEGSERASICPEKFASSKFGSAVLVTRSFGTRTVRGDAYMVEPASAPAGENLALYFPGGQAFGVGAQTILGRLTLDSPGEQKLTLDRINGQLSLPFGMSVRVVRAEFVLVGQGGEHPFFNPGEGAIENWKFGSRLGWDGGGQATQSRAAADP